MKQDLRKVLFFKRVYPIPAAKKGYSKVVLGRILSGDSSFKYEIMHMKGMLSTFKTIEKSSNASPPFLVASTAKRCFLKETESRQFSLVLVLYPFFRKGGRVYPFLVIPLFWNQI